MKKTTTILIQVLVGVIPLIYLASIWQMLPESVPMHYNGKFEADRFGQKSEMLIMLLMMLAITIGTSALILNLDKFDPKKRYKSSNSTITKISWAITILLSLLSVFIVYQTAHFSDKEGGSGLSPKYIFAAIALLFVVLGNLMNTIKPNYFIGIRTPWALENEENWKKTHALGSKIWFFGGLLLLILILLLPADYANLAITFSIFPMAIVPVGYSYYIFLQQKKNNKEPKIN